jgi:membrane fusion protein
MNAKLFRKQALESPKIEGQVLIKLPKIYYYAFLAALLCLFLIFCALFLSSYSKKHFSTGAVLPSGGLISVSAPNGTLSRLLVSEGMVVKKGEPLAEIVQAGINDSRANLTQQTIVELSKNLILLEQRKRSEELISESNRKILIRKIMGLKSEKSNSKIEAQENEDRLQSAKKLFDQIRLLGMKGYVSQVAVLERQEIVQQFASQLRQTKDRYEQLSRQITDTEIEIELIPSRLGNLQQQIQIQESELRQRLNEAKRNDNSVVSAPVSGMVSGIKLYPGDSVKSGANLLYIVPQDSEMIIEIFVPSSVISSLQLGDILYLKYQAFPYQQYGLQPAKVTEVATATAGINDIESGSTPKVALFKVRLKPLFQEVRYGQKRFSIRSGMVVTADIPGPKVALWRFIINPRSVL